MTPRDCKGRTVIHEPTQEVFVVTSGGKTRKAKEWFLKDEQGNSYPFEECQLLEINQLDFDLRRLKAVKDFEGLVRLSNMIGPDRFHQAWMESEKDPIEAATVALVHCFNWQDFCSLVKAYGVSKEQSPQLNQKFKARLKEKGLDGMVANWYAVREAA